METTILRGRDDVGCAFVEIAIAEEEHWGYAFRWRTPNWVEISISSDEAEKEQTQIGDESMPSDAYTFAVGQCPLGFRLHGQRF